MSKSHPATLNFYILPLALVTLGYSSWATACMPYSPEDVFIARFHSATPIIKPIDDHDIQAKYELQFEHPKFVFRSFFRGLQYSQPTQWQNSFNTTNLQANDLVIGLAYSPNGEKPHDYYVTTLASLNCVDDKLVIGKSLSPFVAWNRDNNSCRHDNADNIGVLDGFFDYDQSYYLQQLQEKYPTCQALEQAYPAIDDAALAKGSPLSNMPSTENNSEQSTTEPMALWQRLQRWFKGMFD